MTYNTKFRNCKTKLELDEKEELIKYLCTQGQITIKNGKKVFEFYHDINLEDKFSPAFLLEKAFNNIQNQILGITTKEDLVEDFKVFKKSEFEYFDKYKGYTILEARLNAHNAQYVIQELGFDTRFGSILKCKKYIKLFLDNKEN